MAEYTWTGNAQAVPQVDAYSSPTAPTPGAEYSITVNNKVARYIAVTGDGVPEVFAGLAAAISTSPDPEFKELTPTVEDTPDAFVITGPQDGTQLIYTSHANLGASTERQAATGPNWADNADNYDPAVVPTSWLAGDIFFVGGDRPSIKYKLAVFGTVKLADFVRLQSFTGDIGLRPLNPAGYVEFRDRHVELNTEKMELGLGNGNGPGFETYDLASSLVTPPKIQVLNTGASQVNGLMPLQIINTMAATELEFRGGVGADLARDPKATANLGATSIHSGVVRAWRGVTMTGSAILIRGGELFVEKTADGNYTMQGGRLRIGPTGELTGPVSVDKAAEIAYESNKAITQLTLNHRDAVLDVTAASGPVPVTYTLHEGNIRGSIIPTQTITNTEPAELIRRKL